ncbi:MAG: phosphatidylglycerophosphatase A [Acidobacteria bacterium]|nr:phosphatidylglycerophosphatase A [Acidobacteriota bacterium]MCA1608128.1 phosphatidylglycerophosphatase A [Acidobacteriota bacterium]
MPTQPLYDDVIHTSATIESEALAAALPVRKSALDYIALAVTTFGVGYLPLAPGTFGSVVGVAIYLLFGWGERIASANFIRGGSTDASASAWIHSVNLIAFLTFCLVGIWAAGRATVHFKNKDPKQAVVDEVIGQLIVFLFIPFTFSWKLILAGFVLFRIFDIWKPYPINSLQNLPAGIGVCADDILAGVYAGVGLAIIYAVGLSL